MKKFTTQQQFEEYIEFNPHRGWKDDSKDDISVSFRLWDKRTGDEIIRLTLSTTPDRLKDPDFYGTSEWMTIKPELVKTLYQIYSLLF